MNKLTLKALLLDTITYLKFGKHLHRHYIIARRNLINLSGQRQNISALALFQLIRLVYVDNNIEQEFLDTVHNMKADIFL